MLGGTECDLSQSRQVGLTLDANMACHRQGELFVEVGVVPSQDLGRQGYTACLWRDHAGCTDEGCEDLSWVGVRYGKCPLDALTSSVEYRRLAADVMGHLTLESDQVTVETSYASEDLVRADVHSDDVAGAVANAKGGGRPAHPPVETDISHLFDEGRGDQLVGDFFDCRLSETCGSGKVATRERLVTTDLLLEQGEGSAGGATGGLMGRRRLGLAASRLGKVQGPRGLLLH